MVMLFDTCVNIWEQCVAEQSVVLAEIRAKGAMSVALAGWQVMLAVLGDDIVAVEDRCPHQDTPLCGGRIRNGRVACPRHGAMFDLRTGKSFAAIAPRPLRIFPVRIDGDAVFVALPER
jgi:3-phenylpropionate/trans-cinnamate dioxygenase ferredoxin subunit